MPPQIFFLILTVAFALFGFVSWMSWVRQRTRRPPDG
jgi:hypothetical protein